MLSYNLKKYRKRAGISQKTIAKQLNISQQGYANYETGKATPDPERLLEIAKILKCSMEELTTPYQNNLKKLRTENNITQEQLSKKINVKQNTISNWENGTCDIDNNTLLQLAEIFNCTTDYILGKSEKNKKNNDKIFECSPKEQKLIKAYRSMPEYQLAVDRLLGINDTKLITVYQAAHSEDNHPDGITQMKKKRWDEISGAPETDDPLI